MEKSKLKNIINSFFSILFVIIGIYVWIEQKIFIPSKFHVTETDILNPPAHIITAFSFFIFASLYPVMLLNYKHIRVIREWLFIFGILLMIIGISI